MSAFGKNHDLYTNNVPLREYAADYGQRSRSPSPEQPAPLSSYAGTVPEARHPERHDTLHAADYLLKHPGTSQSFSVGPESSVSGVGLPLKKTICKRHQQTLTRTARTIRRVRSKSTKTS